MMKIIRHIDQLSGELLVFGGVYSNLQALEALYERASALGIPANNILCTGDVVGYCAQPEACVQFVREWGIHCIAGNVELQLAAGAADCGCDFVQGGRCDTFSRQWYPYAQAQLCEASLAWMAALPRELSFRFGGKCWQVVHGSCLGVSDFIFKSTPWHIKAASFEICEAHCILAGHCGLPFFDTKNGKHWLNAGVIGMPANDGTPRGWFLHLWETAGGWASRFLSLEYDHQLAANLMEAAALPRAYSQSLISGLWDNCEILPPEETALQGTRIVLDQELFQPGI
ncbi:MAG: metallophosphatase family protein [Bacteroidetes bacterium]|nr:MAG: metallophosphatase family protein [Bacteroidota bacterium]